MISRELVVADPIAQVVTPPVIHFVALRSPRRGRVARHSPSIAIVGRRLLGRFLLGRKEKSGDGGADARIDESQL